MTDAARFVRRNRVDERSAAAIATVGGVLAATAGARPTGSSAVDVVMVALLAGVTIWASASAPWWAVAAACGIAGTVALDPLIAAIGFVGFVLGLWVGVRRRDLAEMRCALGAVAVNVLIRSHLDGFLGLSAIIGIAVCVGLFVLGVLRRPSAIRRPVWIATGTIGALAMIAFLAGAATAVGSRSDLTAGNRRAREGIEALDDGDYQRAAELFRQSADAFGRADDKLGGAMAAPAALLPAVSQNLSAGIDLSAAARDAMATAATALEQIDPTSLRVIDGTIDLAAIEAAEQPLLDVQAALVDFRATADSVESPWLVDRLRDELVELDAELDENEPRLATAIEAVQLAPQLLGGDEARRYLMLFTSPAESRGIAGFVGNYAELTIDNGTIEVTDFGRRSELDAAALANEAECTGCSQELLDRYGPLGLSSGPGGVAGPSVWTNITLPAHFPYVGEPAQILYPQSGGRQIDGVMSLDPYVVQALMQYTGPIEVDDLGVTVSPGSAADFLLREQYLLAGDDGNEDRIDALETLGQEAIERLLAGALPIPSELAADMGPLVEEHRLLFWTDDPVEQEFLDGIGLLGAMPPLPDDTGFSVFVANSGASKIDVFLERDVSAEVVVGEDGTRHLVADVTLTNTAPRSGLPRYVIGNAVDLPPGTSRLLVTFYGPELLTSLTTSDGEQPGVLRLPEAEWTAYTARVEIAAGSSVSYHLEFDLPPESVATDADTDAGTEIVEWIQPTARRAP